MVLISLRRRAKRVCAATRSSCLARGRPRPAGSEHQAADCHRSRARAGTVPLTLMPALFALLREARYLHMGAREACSAAITGLTTILLWVIFLINLLSMYRISYWLPAVLNLGGLSPDRAVAAASSYATCGVASTLLLGLLLIRIRAGWVGSQLRAQWLRGSRLSDGAALDRRRRGARRRSAWRHHGPASGRHPARPWRLAFGSALGAGRRFPDHDGYPDPRPRAMCGAARHGLAVHGRDARNLRSDETG